MKLTSQGQILLPIARAAISDVLSQKEIAAERAAEQAAEQATWLQTKAACFVTLTKHGFLRGCMGTIEAHRSLLDDVKNNAKAAAFKDRRFPPLTGEELAEIEIEVSLLSAMSAMRFTDEQEALAQLQPGIDGVVFEFGHYRSTFLPQVWQQLPTITEFMAHLKQKAGLGRDFWADEVKLYRYEVNQWKEHDFTKQATWQTT